MQRKKINLNAVQRDMMEHQNKDMMEHQNKDRHQRAYYVNMIAVAAVMRGFLNVIK